MMKRLLQASFILCLFSGLALAQQSTGAARRIVRQNTLPIQCTPGDVLYLITGSVGLYECTATDIWTRFDSFNGLNVKAFGAKGDGVNDDTASIQSALNLAPALVFFPPGTYIVNPLIVRSNTEIELSGGVTLKAKTGYGANDRLLRIEDVQNVTIHGNSSRVQMLKAEYVLGEQRHGVFIIGSSNIHIYDLSSIDTGGDGFYVGSSDTGGNSYSDDVSIVNCIGDNNKRQGISIVSGKHVTVLGGEFRNTIGANPSSGIDIEPNTSADFLEDINVIGTKTTNNAGGGILVVPGHLAEAAGNSISINIIAHTSIADGLASGFKYGGITLSWPAPVTGYNQLGGQINIVGETILSPYAFGVLVQRWPSVAPRTVFSNVSVVNPDRSGTAVIDLGFAAPVNAIAAGSAYVVALVGAQIPASTGNLVFLNCKAEDLRGMPAMQLGAYLYSDTPAQLIKADFVDFLSINQSNMANGYINWNYGSGSVRYTVAPIYSPGGTTGVLNRFGYDIVPTASGVYTLPAAGVLLGQTIQFRNTNNYTLQIRPDGADIISYYGLTAGNDLVLRSTGSYLALKSIAAGVWQVVEQTGEYSPLGFFHSYRVIGRSQTGLAPTTGSYLQGDIVQNDNPVAASFMGWICVQAGSPGIWKKYGIIGERLIGSAVKNFGTIAANATAEDTVNVTGTLPGDKCFASPSAPIAAGIVWGCTPGTGFVTIRLANVTVLPILTAAETWNAEVWKQ